MAVAGEPECPQPTRRVGLKATRCWRPLYAQRITKGVAIATAIAIARIDVRFIEGLLTPSRFHASDRVDKPGDAMGLILTNRAVSTQGSWPTSDSPTRRRSAAPSAHRNRVPPAGAATAAKLVSGAQDPPHPAAWHGVWSIHSRGHKQSV